MEWMSYTQCPAVSTWRLPISVPVHSSALHNSQYRIPCSLRISRQEAMMADTKQAVRMLQATAIGLVALAGI